MKHTLRIYYRKIILSLALAVVGFAAFKMSFTAQMTLFEAAGGHTEDAQLYPIAVDVALGAAYLISIWAPKLTDKLARYLWAAIIFWSAISIIGNGYSVAATPDDQLAIPREAATIVHSIPSITLFLVFHLAMTTAFRPTPSTTATQREGSRSPNAVTAVERTTSGRIDVPPPTAAELLERTEATGESARVIGLSIGRSKSWVAGQIAEERKRRASVAS